MSRANNGLLTYVGCILFTVCGALIFLTGCTSERNISENLQILQLQASENLPQKLILTAPEHRVVLFHNSTAAVVDGVPVLLHDPAMRSADGRWDLAENSVRGILQPVLAHAPFPIRRIVVDPGHGGHDNGAAAVNGRKEKELNLELAKKIAASLRQCGFSVYMTRNSDKYLTLDARTACAKKLNADLFISVHHNASAVNPDAAGMETFALLVKDPAELSRTLPSLRLAYLVQKEQFGVNHSFGRGVKTARFKVLRTAPCPAILIEAGFLTNAKDAFRCSDARHQQKLADAVARAVRGFNAR